MPDISAIVTVNRSQRRNHDLEDGRPRRQVKGSALKVCEYAAQGRGYLHQTRAKDPQAVIRRQNPKKSSGGSGPGAGGADAVADKTEEEK